MRRRRSGNNFESGDSKWLAGVVENAQAGLEAEIISGFGLERFKGDMVDGGRGPAVVFGDGFVQLRCVYSIFNNAGDFFVGDPGDGDGIFSQIGEADIFGGFAGGGPGSGELGLLELPDKNRQRPEKQNDDCK